VGNLGSYTCYEQDPFNRHTVVVKSMVRSAYFTHNYDAPTLNEYSEYTPSTQVPMTLAINGYIQCTYLYIYIYFTIFGHCGHLGSVISSVCLNVSLYKAVFIVLF